MQHENLNGEKHEPAPYSAGLSFDKLHMLLYQKQQVMAKLFVTSYKKDPPLDKAKKLHEQKQYMPFHFFKTNTKVSIVDATGFLKTTY